MYSPSNPDKDDEDFEPYEEDDDDYKPGKKKKPRKKKKQPPKFTPQKSSSKFQVVAEIPIEFDVAIVTNNDDSSEKSESADNPPGNKTNKSEEVGKSAGGEQKAQEPPKKKPRKMITPQRSRISTVTTPAAGSNSCNNGTSEKDPLALTDFASNIPKGPPNSTVNRYPCGYCDTVFTDVSFLERHHKRCKAKRTAESINLARQGPIVNITKPNAPLIYTPSPTTGRFMYACDKCPFSTKNPEHLKYHRPIHNDEQFLSCDQCKFSCRGAEQLNRHKKLHPGYVEPLPSVQETSTTIQSTKNSVYKDESNSSDNIKDGHPNSDMKIKCEKKELEQSDQKTIPKDAPLENNKEEDSSVTFTCDQCTYTTTRPGYLIMHKKIHIRDMPYQCKDCGYKSSRLAYFKKHRMTHGAVDETLVSCDRCSFTTSSQVVLEAHKQCHKV